MNNDRKIKEITAFSIIIGLLVCAIIFTWKSNDAEKIDRDFCKGLNFQPLQQLPAKCLKYFK